MLCDVDTGCLCISREKKFGNARSRERERACCVRVSKAWENEVSIFGFCAMSVVICPVVSRITGQSSDYGTKVEYQEVLTSLLEPKDPDLNYNPPKTCIVNPAHILIIVKVTKEYPAQTTCATIYVIFPTCTKNWPIQCITILHFSNHQPYV